MKPFAELKHFALAFVIALALYVIAYTAIEHGRRQSGPWEVTFFSAAAAYPSLTVSQTNLHITNVVIVFRKSSQLTTNDMVRFNKDRETPFALPFGECEFQGILSQPGTVVMKIFGHEIQLMPRILTIDKREQPWQSGTTISLDPQ